MEHDIWRYNVYVHTSLIMEEAMSKWFNMQLKYVLGKYSVDKMHYATCATCCKIRIYIQEKAAIKQVSQPGSAAVVSHYLGFCCLFVFCERELY